VAEPAGLAIRFHIQEAFAIFVQIKLLRKGQIPAECGMKFNIQK
jgi:hypothetical protein